MVLLEMDLHRSYSCSFDLCVLLRAGAVSWLDRLVVHRYGLDLDNISIVIHGSG
jgi:hypothetical protein